MKMVLIHIFVSVLVFIVGCICYDIQTRQQPLIMVDVNRIIRLTAEGFAKEKLNEDQLQRRVMNFKQDLEESLSEFAVQQRGPGRIRPTQQGREVGVLGQDRGQGAVAFQLTAQHGGMQRAGGCRLPLRGLPCIPPRNLATRQDDCNRDQDPGRAEQPPLGQ